MAVRIAIILFIYLCPLFGQRYNFKKYDVKDGVALSQIGALDTYSNGKLIIATIGGGLNIYDGQEFNLFNTTDGLVNNNVYCLLKENDSLLWLGTERGLSLFDGSKFINYTIKDGLPSETIWSLAQGNDGTVWVGTDNGLAKFKDGKFDIVENSLVLSKGIWSLYSDSQNNLWVGLFNTTLKLQINDGNIIKSSSFPELINSNMFLEDKNKSIWIASDQGLLKISEKDTARFTTKDGLTSNIVYSVFMDSEETIWAGTEEGVSLVSKDGISKLGKNEGLTDYKIWSITEDLENNIWIGSDEGLFKISDMSFKIYKEFNGRAIDVWKIIEVGENEYWILSELQGILKFKDGEFSPLKIGTFRERGLSAFFIDRDKNVWLASERGIYKYLKENYKRPVKIYTDLYGSVNAVIQKENGNILFGTFYDGTIEYEGKSFKKYKSSTSHPSAIYKYLIDSQKRIWAATGDGLQIIEKDSSYTPKGFEKLNNYSFLTISEDKFGTIWAGSYEEGFFTFNSKNITDPKIDKISKEHGLNNHSIMATTFDKDGNLWVSTNAGLNMIDVAEYNKSGKKNILAFGAHDGLPGVEGYQNGLFRDSQNKILFSTIDGLVVFDPDKIKFNTRPPSVEIKSIKVLDKEFKETIFTETEIEKLDGNKIVLPYDNNNLTIQFVGISLNNPSNVLYSYQLNDEEWSKPTSNSIVYLPNLGYGNYVLKMKASNNNGVWSEGFAILNIEITAPFWMVFWIQLVGLVIVFALMVLFYLFRMRRMQRLNMDLEDRIKERIKYEARLKKSAKELRLAKESAENSDKLKTEFLAQMSHEIRTPINSILSYTGLLKEDFKDKLEESTSDGFAVIENSSHRLIRTIDSILNLSQLQTESLDLNKKQNNITKMIKDLVVEFKGIAKTKNLKLETELYSDDCSIYVDQYTTTQMLANLIDNAIKYTNKGKVVVSLKKCDDKKVVLEVTDTGIGMNDKFKEKLFQPFTQEEQGYSRKYDGSGLGLSLVKKYADINKAQLTFTSTKNVGTTFRIEFNV